MTSLPELQTNFQLRHLLTLTDMQPAFVLHLFEKAMHFFDAEGKPRSVNLLADKTIISLFYEPSTRTRVSFDIAAKKLGAATLHLDIAHTSTQKGEALLDMVDNLAAMSADVLIIRHPVNGTPETIAEHLQQQPISIINAGDGTHAHPSQALIDAFTIHQYYSDFSQLSIVIVGDIEHSRVARSNITLLKLLGVRDIRIVAPKALLPKEGANLGVTICDDLPTALAGAHVVMSLRLQKERMQQAFITDMAQYHQEFGLTAENLKNTRKELLILHPGPINRGIEIASDIADGPNSLILKQVRNGVAVRMAILSLLNA